MFTNGAHASTTDKITEMSCIPDASRKHFPRLNTQLLTPNADAIRCHPAVVPRRCTRATGHENRQGHIPIP